MRSPGRTSVGWPLLLILLITAPGCATGRINLWPFYFHETRIVRTADGPRQVSTTEVFPFFERQSEPDTTWHAVRPFYNYEHSRTEDHHQVQYIWPLGLHFKKGDMLTEHRLFPFFHYIKTWSPSLQKYSKHAHVIQLIRWGNHARFGRYFALFPLGGVTHGVISDTWSFVAFPFYSYYRHGDYVRRDFPWPFAGRGRTPDGVKQMYRFWPFYVSQVKKGPDELRARYDVMWPFVRWGTLDRGGNYYHRMTAVTPFYSSVRTFDRKGHVVACVRSVLGVLYCTGTPPQGGRSGWSALWTLVKDVETTKTDEFRVIPFYWRTTRYVDREEEPERTFTRRRIIWPLIWLDADHTDPKHYKGSIVVAPFYWHYTDKHRDDEGDERKARRITFWPLFTSAKEADGARHFWIVSHGWIGGSTGYKRNYRALFDFFQYHHRADGEAETRVLSRLYHHRRGPWGRYFSLAGLFTYDGTGEVVGEDGKYWSALFGLVKRSWTDQGSRWRILYIPLGGKGVEDDDAAAS